MEPGSQPPAAGLAAGVLAQAGRNPGAVAVVDGDRRLDYAELDAASAAVAHGLRRAGVRPGQAVAVCLPRCWQLVCAMLGILRLGAVVVPLDAQSPPQRRHHILTDSASVALVHGGAAPGGAPDGVRPLAVSALLGRHGHGEPLPAAVAAPVSFVFYTSGTTGSPKGVEVPESGILRLARPGYIQLGGPGGGSRFACLSNPAFDALSFEVWVPLLTGGCCVVLDDDAVATPHLLAEALRRERIDTMFVTATLFNTVVDTAPDCFAGVGQVLVGGEQLNARLIRRWYRDNPTSATRLYNGYGPTEATTFALCHPIPRDFAGDVVPIGRPLPGTEALLVVDGARPAAPGEVAELHLGGDGLAAGYRNLPGETAHRFVRLPWLDGGRHRYFRSGDLVRADADGLVEYVGRADRQVKVRGFRIEPGELERQIVAHPAIRQAHVCTRRDAALGGNELLAYLVLDRDSRDHGLLSLAEFDRHLAARLPPYMRPHHVYVADSLPRNANGKIDQDALLRGDHRPLRHTGGADEPATAWQREVLDLAGRVLGVTDLRLNDRWIANGGDSLKALRLRFEVRRRWGCDLPQALVLRCDMAQLAATIAAGKAPERPGAPPAAAQDGTYPVPAAPSGARSAPATSEQQRLWLLHQQAPRSCAYNVGLAFTVRGDVDAAALRQALRRLVVRYPALRTAFEATRDGLHQVVGQPYDPWVEPAGQPGGEDGWRAIAGELCATPFDLSQPRMLRACWLPAADGSSGVLLLHLHHIAVDGWSLTVLFEALSAEYAAALDGRQAPATDAPTPLDFAAWQAEWFSRPAYLAQREALRAHYAGPDEVGAPRPPLGEPSGPGDGARAAAGARLLRTSLDARSRAALDRLGAELELTRFQVLLAAFAWSLYGVTGRSRPRIASPVANRPVHDFEASVGMFANTVLVPLTVAPREDLRAQLRRHGAQLRPVLDGQDVAFADVLADLLADHNLATDGPPFDYLFVLENTDFAALSLPGCRTRPEWVAPAEPKCPLVLSVVEHDAGFDCLWEYDAGCFEPAEVRAAAGLFQQALDRLADGGATTVAELVAPYRRGLPDHGRGIPMAPDFTTIAAGFARQVELSPRATALVDGDRGLSYAELDAHAAALAADLQRRYLPAPDGDGPRSVALHFDPSVEHVVALLALARLNLTIVPLDPAYPPALLRRVLDQVRPLCVLHAPGTPAGTLDAIAADGIARHPVTVPSATATAAAMPEPPPPAGRPLYTLFTSGSTGTPKGVQVPDRTLCNLLHWQGEAGGLAGGAATMQFSMLSFDVSFQEIFGTLCAGGRLHLVRPGWRQDLPALLDHLETAGIERIFMPYVALQLLAEHGVRLGRHPSRLREVVTAGEQLVCTDAIRRWFAGMPGARLFNHYGPSETHVVSSLCLDGDPARWPSRPAIGRPVANAWLRVVDEADEPVPPGCTGRLLIGGPMAAPCYLGDASLNRARFVELPGAGTFFRSGDNARFDRDGLLHFLGRDDEQIKLGGHRLELGQVEAALLQHPAVLNAVAVADRGQLVACLQCRGQAPSPRELSAHLARLLPSYVRVDRFRLLPQLPRTPSGKLDRRRALTEPGDELRPRTAPLAQPATSPQQARLAELFQSVVGTPIEPDQRFADAGAGSLALMRFHLRCTAELGVQLAVADLFEHVTIRRLAAFLEGRPAGRDGAAPAADEPAADEPAADEPAADEPAADVPVAAVAPAADEPIAVVGLAVRLPGAADLAAFWAMVRAGGRGIEHFEAADGLVGARSQLAGMLAFDPGHFGISRREARLMDPQQRHLLMSSVEALAHAGIADPGRRRIGLVASCGENTYFQAMQREADPADLPDGFQLVLHHDKDFLATKVAYHLGLTGPAFTVQAACASSLVAVHVAAGLLRQGDSEVMLAGGVLVDTQLSGGYRYRPQHIFSKDGHCRPFSDDASGTIGASGVGVVVLKPLRLARRDGDTVYAVVTGSALNNDGAGKLGYTAPSLAGQREVIRAALRRTGRSSADLAYVEAHGTGTELGDPVEVSALRQAFDRTAAAAGSANGSGATVTGADVTGSCALASVKSQIGHLGAAAGVVGLARAALAVHHGVIPPNVDFRRLNPKIGADAAPFYVPTRARPWPAGRPRVAAVSSFGIGGTNAHLVIEAPAPGTPPEPAPAELPCLVLSSSSAAALRADAARIAGYLEERPEAYRRVLRHLQAGRPAHRWRMAAVCTGPADAVAWLRCADAVLVPASDAVRPADGGRADELAEAWLAGETIRWPAGPAQPPWDFPPPAFELADYDFERAAAPAGGELPAGDRAPSVGWPRRLPEADWLHQPHWVRLRRAGVAAGPRSSGVLVVMAAEPLPPHAPHAFETTYSRVVQAVAGAGFARLADGSYRVDPADPGALRQLLDVLTGELTGAEQAGIDWLHALPLAVGGAVGEQSLAAARWACLDTPAALLQAVSGTPHAPRLRPWWLSYAAQPVDGPGGDGDFGDEGGGVRRPELGLLAGVCEVAPQECGIDGHWLDLPDGRLAEWAPQLAALLAQAAGTAGTGERAAASGAAVPRRLALRHGYWWRQALLPVTAPPATALPATAPPATAPQPAAGTAVHLVIGGTGGIGRSIAGWLLANGDCRVILLARRARLPAELAPWADRVDVVDADLADATPEAVMALLARHTGRLDGVVHAAGVAAGGLIIGRDAAAMRDAAAVKLRGALLVERLIERYRPAFAAYCSSMSSIFGGIGQLDYAAGNGLLDAFARHRAGSADTTARLAINWDAWRDVGMARRALASDAHHQAHLAVGLTVPEGQRLFATALGLDLPQLLVCTTALDEASRFYAPPAAPPAAAPAAAAATPAAAPAAAAGPDAGITADAAALAEAELSAWLCRWLGLERLDPAASLYELGADSLMLLDLIDEVRRRYGADIELTRLSHQASLNEVLAVLARAAPAGSGTGDPVAVEVWQEGRGHDVLCLVHPIGGDIQAYRSLVPELDPRLTVCLIADPALHRPELPAWPLDERAGRYHAALQARFPSGQWRWRLAGWSFGAWVALAMAAEAEAAGRPATGLYLLDPPPPDAGRREHSYDEAQLRALFAHELGQAGGPPPAQRQPEGHQARAHAERLARCCRNNLDSMAGHTLPRPTRTPSLLWLAGRPLPDLPAPGSPDEQRRLWQAQLPTLAGFRFLDTTHYGMVRPPHVLAVADAINASLPVLTAC